MDCFGTYFTHVFSSWSDSWQSMGEVPVWISATSATLHRNPLVCCWSCCRKHESRVVIWRRGSIPIKCSIPPCNSKFVGFLWSVAKFTITVPKFHPTSNLSTHVLGVRKWREWKKKETTVSVRNQMNLVRGACKNIYSTLSFENFSPRLAQELYSGMSRTCPAGWPAREPSFWPCPPPEMPWARRVSEAPLSTSRLPSQPDQDLQVSFNGFVGPAWQPATTSLALVKRLEAESMRLASPTAVGSSPWLARIFFLQRPPSFRNLSRLHGIFIALRCLLPGRASQGSAWKASSTRGPPVHWFVEFVPHCARCFGGFICHVGLGASI